MSFNVVIYTLLKQYRSDWWIKGCLLVDRLMNGIAALLALLNLLVDQSKREGLKVQWVGRFWNMTYPHEKSTYPLPFRHCWVDDFPNFSPKPHFWVGSRPPKNGHQDFHLIDWVSTDSEVSRATGTNANSASVREPAGKVFFGVKLKALRREC